MAIYRITDAAPGGPTFDCSDDVYILDAAEDVGLSYPYASRSGGDSTSVGILLSGSVNQEDQFYLSEKQMRHGFVLTDVAYPLSDCVIQFNAEPFLLDDDQIED